MDKLSDFKPLERFELPNVREIQCSGLVLIVGPNSSGKTQLLLDLYMRLIGQPRPLVVASKVLIRKADHEPLVAALEAEGYFQTVVEDNGTKKWIPQTTFVGTGAPIEQISLAQAHELHSGYQAVTDPHASTSNPYLNYFGKLVVTALFLERSDVPPSSVAFGIRAFRDCNHLFS